MLDRIVASLTDRGCLLDPDAAAYIAKQPQPESYLDGVLHHLHELPLFLTLDTLRSLETPLLAPQTLADVMPTPAASLLHADPLAKLLATDPSARLAGSRPHAADFTIDCRVLRDSSTNPPTSGDVRDFVRYFNHRLEALTRLLKQRREVANNVRIKDVARAGKDVQLIGLVKEKSRRPTGHRFLTLEDATGEIDVLVPGDKPELQGSFDSLLPDEVIGVVGHPTRDGGLVLAESLIRPDLPYQQDRQRPEGNLYAGFLGDVHVGSKTFLEDEFRRMVRWLKGDQGTEREQRVARSIKYLVFPGDLVDGVGVYPGQQEGLAIENVFEQYRQLAKELETVPDYMHLVFLPGNHDASRPTEPQPALEKDIKGLFNRHSTTFVSNPSQFSLHGVNVLAYHGYSMIDFATTVPGLRMDQPVPIMKQMLQCRHLAPTYGGKTPILPEERDSLIIDAVPDLFVTGHIHVAAMDKYKGVGLVNGGTWQAQTDYQKMQNLVPTPARLPLVNLTTMAGSMIDFGAG